MNKIIIIVCFFLACIQQLMAQSASTIKETRQVMKTYPFSDPNPVANPDALYYPYFRFDGYTEKGVNKEWKVVELENQYIKVSILPEIGGKIWGAVEKSTNTDFIYFNHVVKFRDIAMRGAWTSGGIEPNFGVIGHAPTCSTPVDYLMRTNEDESVSCFISAVELVTRTTWCVEINLPKDKAYFTTKVIWYNSSSISQPYYHWMNAGYKASGNLEFCFPGNNYIGHGGDSHSFPIEDGREVSWYEKNNFGQDKSYHVLGKYNDFYAAYWHDENFGSAHYAPYDEKLGMKIFLWGLSRSGEIWEGLLTDSDGQYVELQSGRMYNQPASNSAYTPYKHTSFAPQQTDEWTEYWFPIKDTNGVSKVSTLGAIHVKKDASIATISLCPLQKLSSTPLKVYIDGNEVLNKSLDLEVLQTWKESISLPTAKGKIKIIVGNNELIYTEDSKDTDLNRPKVSPSDFDWESVYGLYVQGEQFMTRS